jgi:hypothetical protein
MTAHRTPLSRLEQGIPFEQRHIGPDAGDRAKMLAQVGYGSLDELTAAAVPEAIKSTGALRLPEARTEAEVLAELRGLAGRLRDGAREVRTLRPAVPLDAEAIAVAPDEAPDEEPEEAPASSGWGIDR